MATYIYIDVSKKQEFIFKNNKLRDNLYNSLVIKGITEFIKEDELNKNLNLNCLSIKLSDKLPEQEGNLIWEHIFSGGGNSILKFQNEKVATDFIKDYSKEVLLKYPELELYMSYFTPQNDEEEKYEYVIKRLKDGADEQKDARRSRFRRISYGIEKIDETGKPEVYKGNDGKVQDKEYDENRREAKKYFENTFKKKIDKHVPNLESKIKITYDLDDYKRRNPKQDKASQNTTKSYIGVISIDGNKMGDLVKKIKDFDILKDVGKIIEDLYSVAIGQAINKVVEGAQQPLLITPIVFAGDDICIITEAEKSIRLAAEILNQIQSLSKVENFANDNLKALMNAVKINKLTACGGVSIVKAGYPFFEAVALAEEMCKNAKLHTHKLKKEELEENGNIKSENASFLDWTVIKGGKKETLEYLDFVDDNNYKSIFSIKPLYIKNDNSQKLYTNNVFTYQGFKLIVENILKEIDNKKSNLTSSGLQKIKEAMYLGEDRYKMLLEVHDIKLDKIFEENEKIEAGILEIDEKKVYVLRDIIEALDFWE